MFISLKKNGFAKQIILTSIVLSLKYLIYSGPRYRGGLQVIRNTENANKKQYLTLCSN